LGCSSTKGSVTLAAEMLERRRLGLREGLEHRAGQPRMAFGELLAKSGHVHDREHTGVAVVVLGDGGRIVEKPADIRILEDVPTRRTRTDEAIDLATVEQIGDGAALWRVLDVSIEISNHLFSDEQQ